MKKHLTIGVLLIFITSTSFGQLKKGNILLGGNGSLRLNFIPLSSLNQSFTNTSKEYRINVNPTIGYFLTDEIAVGVNLPLV